MEIVCDVSGGLKICEKSRRSLVKSVAPGVFIWVSVIDKLKEQAMLELKREDLFETCAQCKGTGDLRDCAPAKFPHFGIAGGVADVCAGCKGAGGRMTSAGEVVRDFVIYLNRSGKIQSRN
jgi:hypothetical protein